MSITKLQQLDFPKLDGMTLGLQRDGPALQHELTVTNQLLCLRVALIQLRLVVFQDRFSIDDVFDDVVATHFNFDRHPTFGC